MGAEAVEGKGLMLPLIESLILSSAVLLGMHPPSRISCQDILGPSKSTQLTKSAEALRLEGLPVSVAVEQKIKALDGLRNTSAEFHESLEALLREELSRDFVEVNVMVRLRSLFEANKDKSPYWTREKQVEIRELFEGRHIDVKSGWLRLTESIRMGGAVDRLVDSHSQ